MTSESIVLGIAGAIVGFFVAFWLKGRIVSRKVEAAERDAAKIIEESRHKAETLLKEAEVQTKDTLFKLKSDFDQESRETLLELKKREARLVQKEETLDRKIEQVELRDQELTRRERQTQKREQKIEARELEITNLIDEQKRQLERISGLTAEYRARRDRMCDGLREIGFVDGERVEVVAAGPLGAEPLLIQVGFTRFALRRAEAARVRLRSNGAGA